jgi:hypothetical protein
MSALRKPAARFALDYRRGNKIMGACEPASSSIPPRAATRRGISGTGWPA